MSYYYKLNMTEENQEYLFASLGADLYDNSLPDEFDAAPLVEVRAEYGDAIINLYQAPTKLGFKVICGSVGLVPSIGSPIHLLVKITSLDEEETVAEDSPALLTNAWVKERFPQWETLCTRADGAKTANEMLTIAIEESSIEFAAFFDGLTADTMTNEYKIHLLKLIKEVCFNFMHGDIEFKVPTQITKDAKHIRDLLEKGLIGSETIVMTAKEREFKEDEWFTDSEYDLWYNQDS